MSGPISVGTSYKSWTIWVPAGMASFFLPIGLLALLTGGLQQAPGFFGGMIGSGSVLSILAGVATWEVIAGRLWVEDLGTGFRIIRRRQEQVFADSDVQGLAWWTRKNLSECSGALLSTTNHARLWISGPTKPEIVTLRCTVKPGQDDSLKHMIARLLARLHQRACQKIQQNKVIRGAGWELGPHGLIIRQGDSELFISTQNLDSVRLTDDSVCIWQKGDELPTEKLPVQAENALLLHWLLSERLPVRVNRPVSSAGSDLGKVVLDLKSAFILPPLGLGLCFSLVGMVGLIGSGKVGAIVFLLLGSLGLLLALKESRKRFRCHEQGVSFQSWRRNRRLRFEEVSSFACHSIRPHEFFISIFGFRHANRISFQRIRYRAFLKGADADLALLRDYVSAGLARRMVQEIAQGRQVEWTQNLRLHFEGIEFRPSCVLGRKGDTLA